MSFYYDRNATQFDGLLAVYVENILSPGKKKFKHLTLNEEKFFKSKPGEYIPFLFPGINIERNIN